MVSLRSDTPTAPGRGSGRRLRNCHGTRCLPMVMPGEVCERPIRTPKASRATGPAYVAGRWGPAHPHAAIRAWLAVLRVSESGGRQGPRASASARRIAPGSRACLAMRRSRSTMQRIAGQYRPRSSAQRHQLPGWRWTRSRGGMGPKIRAGGFQVREAERQTRSIEGAVTTSSCGVKSRLGRALCT